MLLLHKILRLSFQINYNRKVYRLNKDVIIFMIIFFIQQKKPKFFKGTTYHYFHYININNAFCVVMEVIW